MFEWRKDKIFVNSFCFSHILVKKLNLSGYKTNIFNCVIMFSFSNIFFVKCLLDRTLKPQNLSCQIFKLGFAKWVGSSFFNFWQQLFCNYKSLFLFNILEYFKNKKNKTFSFDSVILFL